MIEFSGARNPARADDLPVTNGSGYLVEAAAAKAAPGVLVLHAWWGLNDTFRSYAERLAAEGFTVLAPDLFGGEVATTIEEAEALSQPRETIESEQIALEQKVLGAADFLIGKTGGPICALGFSFGASYALWLAAKKPADIAAVVVYYGAYLGVRGESPVLGHFAPDDKWAFDSPGELDEFEAQLRDSGRPFEFHRYPGTKHWFVEPDRPEYDQAAADLAWQRTLDFLRQHLGK